MRSAQPTRLVVRSLTPSRWSDLVRLFGPRGASGGCWCMYWRRKRSEYNANKGAGNRSAFRKIVQSGAPTGILAYRSGEPIAWCAIAPRADYGFREVARRGATRPIMRAASEG